MKLEVLALACKTTARMVQGFDSNLFLILKHKGAFTNSGP